MFWSFELACTVAVLLILALVCLWTLPQERIPR